MTKSLDLTGRVFGMRTVLERAGTSPSGKSTWRVQCACGRVDVLVGSSLVHGRRDKCVSCRRRLFFEAGSVFGNLELIADLGVIDGHEWWETRCLKCGTEKKQRSDYVKSRRATRCSVCYGKRGGQYDTGGNVPGWYFLRVVERALVRGLELSITPEYVESLWDAQAGRCALTGWSLHIAPVRKGSNRADTTASLDRINSDQGYVPGNVQWVHKRVNHAKMATSDSDFVELCVAVAEHSR